MIAGGQRIAYGLVAGICLATNSLLMVTADALGLSLATAFVLCFAIMVVFGYLLLTAWAFPGPRCWRGFGRYTLAMAANAPANATILWLLLKIARLPMAIASPLTSILVALLGYLFSRWALTFSPRGAEPA